MNAAELLSFAGELTGLCHCGKAKLHPLDRFCPSCKAEAEYENSQSEYEMEQESIRDLPDYNRRD